MCAVATRTRKPAAIEGTDREGFATIEEVRSSVGRHLMHGRNGRAIVQTTTAAVGTQPALLCEASAVDPRGGRQSNSRFERAADYQFRVVAGKGNLIPWGNWTTLVASLVLEPRRLDQQEGDALIRVHLPQRAANATN